MMKRKILGRSLLLLLCTVLFTCDVAQVMEALDMSHDNPLDPENPDGYVEVFNDPSMVNIIPDEDSPEFSWQNQLKCSNIIDESNTKTAYYHIQISEIENSFDSLVHETIGIKVNTEDNSISIGENSLESGKTYYWQVRATLSSEDVVLGTNGIDWGVWSESGTFTTKNIISGSRTDTMDTTPSVNWSQSEGSDTITGYDYSYTLYNDDGSELKLQTGTSTISSINIDTVLEYGSKITYKIRPVKDDDIKGFWSPSYDINIIEPTITGFSIGETHNTSPVLFWDDLNVDSQTYTYEVCYSENDTAIDQSVFNTELLNEMGFDKEFIYGSTINWQVRSKNSDGVLSSWSSINTLNITSPVLTPITFERTHETTPKVSWNELEDDQMTYTYEVCYSTNDDSIDESIFDAVDDNEFVLPVTLSFGDRVNWKFRAKNNNEIYTDWSSENTFIIDWDFVISPVYPIDNANDVDKLHATIDWEDLDGAQSYNIVVGLDENLSTDIVTANIELSEYTITDDLDVQNGDMVYWKVQPVNEDGLYDNSDDNGELISGGEWSDTFSYTVNINWNYTITPTYPVGGSLNEAAEIDTRYPVLDWNDIEGAESYNIVISSDDTLTHEPITVSLSQFTTQYNLHYSTLDSNNGSTIYWKVQAVDTDGFAGEWSDIFSYTINIIINSDLDIGHDLDNPIDITLTPNALTITNDDQFTVTADVEGFPSYQWYLDGNLISDVASSSVTIDAANMNYGVYEVTCVVNESGAYGSEKVQFEVMHASSLMNYNITSPSNDEVITNADRYLDWDDIEGAGMYKIQLSDQSDFSNIIVEDRTLYESQYSVSSLNDSNYYWRISANKGNGWEQWSSSYTFGLDLVPATDVESFNYTIDANYITMSWVNPDYMDFYKVYIVRKEGVPATGYDDPAATVVYDGNDITFSETLPNNANYYYTVYSADASSYSPGILVTTEANIYTFTNAESTGRLGPTQNQLDASYLGTTLEGKVTSLEGIQEWAIPYDGTYRITVYGARGGNQPQGYSLGYGSKMRGDFDFNSGDIIKILAGQMGSNNGYSDGGAGGGGGSFVVSSDNTPLIIAGGGGGEGGDSGGYHASITESGTNGYGESNAGTNGNGAANGDSYAGAGGGFYTDGAGSYAGSSFLNGGVGGDYGVDGGFGGGGAARGSSYDQAGGGGGYSGGGDSYEAGGGGGSFNSGENQDNAEGANSGHGYVVIYGPLESVVE